MHPHLATVWTFEASSGLPFHPRLWFVFCVLPVFTYFGMDDVFFAVNQRGGSLIFYCHGKHAALALTSNATFLDRPELEQCFLQTPSYAEI